jgi:cell division protein FtsB
MDGDKMKMKNKKSLAFFPEEIVKLIIAIFGIVVLLYLAYSLASIVWQNTQMQQAKATLEEIVNKIDFLETQVEVYEKMIKEKEDTENIQATSDSGGVLPNLDSSPISKRDNDDPSWKDVPFGNLLITAPKDWSLVPYSKNDLYSEENSVKPTDCLGDHCLCICSPSKKLDCDKESICAEINKGIFSFTYLDFYSSGSFPLPQGNLELRKPQKILLEDLPLLLGIQYGSKGEWILYLIPEKKNE